MTNLLPCPFCGAAARVRDGNNLIFAVACSGCNAGSDAERCAEDAATKWNRRALPAPDGWQDISSAPKDGTPIHVWKDGYASPVIAIWHRPWYAYALQPVFGDLGSHWAMVLHNFRFDRSNTLIDWYVPEKAAALCLSREPTHWRPLPAPPRAQGADDAGKDLAHSQALQNPPVKP